MKSGANSFHSLPVLFSGEINLPAEWQRFLPGAISCVDNVPTAMFNGYWGMIFLLRKYCRSDDTHRLYFVL
jgi:hypothetical protein